MREWGEGMTDAARLYDSGLSIAEISRQMGVSATCARTYLLRAERNGILTRPMPSKERQERVRARLAKI